MLYNLVIQISKPSTKTNLPTLGSKKSHQAYEGAIIVRIPVFTSTRKNGKVTIKAPLSTGALDNQFNP